MTQPCAVKAERVWTIHELSAALYDQGIQHAIVEGPEVKINEPPVEVIPRSDLARAVKELRLIHQIAQGHEGSSAGMGYSRTLEVECIARAALADLDAEEGT